MTFRALVIEPDGIQCRAIRTALLPDNWVVFEVDSPEEAMKLIDQHDAWAIVFCDMGESGKELDVLRELKMRIGDTVPIIMTAARVNPQTVLETMLNGAFDFIGKPYREAEIRERSRFVIERLHAAERESHNRQQDVMPDFTSAPAVGQYEIVGKSEAITKVTSEIAKALRKDRDKANTCEVRNNFQCPPTFFITGETGTGKELIARMIHHYSKGASAPFIPVNCGNLTLELVESKLFGHTQGAFTGALKTKVGMWELADGGTLFLDEITEAPPSVLPKLLRVLQDGRVERIGSNKWTQTHVQVIAASNRDMKEEVKAGRFRSDLYHRLSLHRLHIPPLRERLQDVPLIIEHLTHRHFARQVRFAQEALNALMSYDFPGNVRELENIVRGAAGKSPDGVIYAVDLAAYIEVMEADCATPRAVLDELLTSAKTNAQAIVDKAVRSGLEEQTQCFKVQVVQETLARYQGNVTQAARSLKISRQNLYNILKMATNI